MGTNNDDDVRPAGPGRPERPIDPSSGPLHAFADDLRTLRKQAGNPTYEAMARHTGRSKTALANAASGVHVPRWRTVEAYVTECGGDTTTWRARWKALSEQESSATAAVEPPLPTPSRPSRRWLTPRRRRWFALTGAAVLVGAGILVAVIMLRPASAPALVASPGVSCDAMLDAAVVIMEITAADGRGGIATQNRVVLEQRRVPRPGFTFWIILHLLNLDGMPFVAKARLGPVSGPDLHVLQLNSGVGSRRDIWVVEADPVANTMLEQNLASQLDASQDPLRRAAPAGEVVSAVCHVEKTRDI